MPQRFAFMGEREAERRGREFGKPGGREGGGGREGEGQRERERGRTGAARVEVCVCACTHIRACAARAGVSQMVLVLVKTSHLDRGPSHLHRYLFRDSTPLP